MNALFFDTLSRRASLAGVGITGMATMDTFRAAARNKNRNRRSNVDKKAKQKCKQQVGPCTTILESECNGDPVCLACCAFAGRCDFAGFINCVDESQG